MKMPRALSFADWCRAVDRRIVELEPSLEFALSEAKQQFVEGRLIRTILEGFAGPFSWYNQGRSVYVVRLQELAQVQTMSAIRPSPLTYTVDLYDSTVEAVAVDIATYLIGHTGRANDGDTRA
jgi:hypothetical protein